MALNKLAKDHHFKSLSSTQFKFPKSLKKAQKFSNLYKTNSQSEILGLKHKPEYKIKSTNVQRVNISN